MDTKGRGGSTLNKGFTVYTNDTTRPQVRLEVTGKVRRYVTLTPSIIRFFGQSGTTQRQTVEIVPIEGHSFSITEVKALQNKFINFKVKPLDKATGKQGYLLQVENTKAEPGNYRDTIMIKTDNKKSPMLRVPVYARIQDPTKIRGSKTK